MTLRHAQPVLAAVLLVSGCWSTPEDGGADTGVDGLPVVPDRAPHEDGWRWESSLGIELAVPGDWKINDTDCRQTAAPTVVRAPGFQLHCLTPEPESKQIVEITLTRWDEEPAPPPEFPKLEVVIDGEPVERIEGQIADGRAAGWLLFTERDALVRARVRDEALLHRIFDSVRVVDVDTHGCATSRKDMKLKPPRTNTLVPPDATEISVCYFDQDELLLTSALIEGAEAMNLVELLNRAKPGHNPGVPADLCREEQPKLADTVLITRGASSGAVVGLWFSGCHRRGFRNGRTTSRLTTPLLQAIMTPIHSGYGYAPQGLE